MVPNREKEARLSIDRLREILSYNADTGGFRWKVRVAIRCNIGDIAGSTWGKYRQIKIDGDTFLANRLAWFYTTGQWPPDQIDHRDLDHRNDRFDNLRPCTNAQNGQNKRKPSNNTSGFVGVSRHKVREKWVAYIRIDGVLINLGLFDKIEDAVEARALGKAKYHPFAADQMPAPSGLILPAGMA